MFIPPRLISAYYDSVEATENWPESDGGFYDNFPYRWRLQLTVQPQNHGSHRTRELYVYTGFDVVVGDWIADIPRGLAVRIIEIESATDQNLTVIVEDVDRFNIQIGSDGSGVGGIGSEAVIYTLSEAGIPILAPAPAALLGQNAGFVADQTGRFAYRNLVQSFFRVEQAGHTLAVGDVVRIRTEAPNIGAYEKVVQGQTVEGIVGVVNSIGTPGVNWFTYRPSGRVVTNLLPTLPGNAGSLIYLDNSGAYTATRPSAFAKPIFIRLTGDGSIGLQLDRNVDATPPAIGFIAQTYVVADITERDALTGLNDGDQVKVRDAGNGEWAQFLYDNGQWRLMVTQDASDTDAETLDAVVTPLAPSGPLGVLSATSSISNVTVNITTPFTGTATLTVGTPGDPDAFMSADMSDLSQLGVFAAYPSVVLSDETEVIYTLTTNGTQGSAVVSISYV